MKKLTGEEIIRTFIEYFKEHGHLEVASASLIPKDDPSVLWINAGVTPLKKYFDGSIIPSSRRLTSCQKCIRTNDIENVGKTARHHTLFQMLGNFSIGDYFKDEALAMAWELLTSEKYFGMDKNKLYVTVYPTDTDAYNIWVKLGVEPSHIIKLEGNFWEIGPGPSGPDSEIFYDRGEIYDKDKLGIKLLEQDIENDRYIEIWNNVFSQFNAKDGIPRSEYQELPSKNIDTGMGVERMACILQNTETNYETDLFMPIIKKIEEISNLPYRSQMEFKVIADHIRTLTFAISDGANPENYGRGYVLRRLLRRAVKMGRRLNINRAFLAELVDVVIEKYSNIYPELTKNKEEVKNIITKEEELFHKTLLSGEKRLEEIFTTSTTKVISGKDAFKLYDTYGFPIELIMEYAEEKEFNVDLEEFNKYMKTQRDMARNSRKVESSMNLQNEELMNFKEESKFVGYDTLENTTEVIGIMKDNIFVESLDSEGYIVLKECPFYAESGGQIADSGYLKNNECKLEVIDVVKSPNNQHLIKIKVLEGIVKKNTLIQTYVMKDKRLSITKNHSAAHLLQKSLQELLGNSVHQAGSKIDDETFRFDFIYHGKLSDEMLLKIEEKVNERINQGNDTIIEYTTVNEAKEKGAMALFTDKYGDTVRLVTMGDSSELCAGTHVKNTKEIEKFAIISMENKGTNTYRITGATSDNITPKLVEIIKPYNDKMLNLLAKAKEVLTEADKLDINLKFDFNIDNTVPSSYKDMVYNRYELETLSDNLKELEKEFFDKKTSIILSNLDTFTNTMVTINDISVIASITTDYDVNIIKQIVDALANKLDKYFIILANIKDNNVNYVCRSNYDKINCGYIVKQLATKSNGNGGGSAFFAQGGGTNITMDDVVDLLTDIKQELKELK